MLRYNPGSIPNGEPTPCPLATFNPWYWYKYFLCIGRMCWEGLFGIAFKILSVFEKKMILGYPRTAISCIFVDKCNWEIYLCYATKSCNFHWFFLSPSPIPTKKITTLRALFSDCWVHVVGRQSDLLKGNRKAPVTRPWRVYRLDQKLMVNSRLFLQKCDWNEK